MRTQGDRVSAIRVPAIRIPLAAALLAACLGSAGCAYFNTFYSAKRNFDAAEKLYLNPEDRSTAQQAALYDKAIASATKLLVSYPKSKYVDDAVMITGRSLMGKGEYEKARQTFSELSAKAPDTPYIDQAIYYTAECYRREHKWDTAQVYYDSLRLTYPKSWLLDEATLRQAQIKLSSLQARDAAALLHTLNPSKLSDRAAYEWHHTLADAYYTIPSYDSARVEYEWIAREAKSPEAYHEAMLRQGDCLEGAHNYAAAAEHYRQYERTARLPSYRDQASIRRASALASGGRVAEGLQLLQDIVNDKARLSVAPEALYRIGYIQEVQTEDVAAARATYAKVGETYKGSPFALQAQQRSTNLDKIKALRAAAASDTTGRENAANAAFGVAERLLVDTDRPDRALAEYAKVETEFAGTEAAPKASFAAGWVYYRKLLQKERADSVWKHLVDRYPDTVYGRAASAILRGKVDSLRAVGSFGATLIRVPYSPNALPYVPAETKIVAQKSVPTPSRADSVRAARMARADSLGSRPIARPDTSRAKAPADTTQKKAPADTTSHLPPPSTTRNDR